MQSWLRLSLIRLMLRQLYLRLRKYLKKSLRLPILISATITDASGRTLSGQTTEAFWASVQHAKPLSVGLNCALGAEEMRPYIEILAKTANCFVSAHPNGGFTKCFWWL